MSIKLSDVSDPKLRKRIEDAMAEPLKTAEAHNAPLVGYCKITPFTTRSDVSPRIRQSQKPLMNKLETEWFDFIGSQFPNYPRPRAQAVTLRLANGVRYTPDFFAFMWPVDAAPPGPTAWECKGKHAWEDAIVKLKVAATAFPEIRFVLVWKDVGGWSQQAVRP